MNATTELVATIERDRERAIRRDHLARIAAAARACCHPGTFARLTRALRGIPAAS
jgi:hypothetical protein